MASSIGEIKESFRRIFYLVRRLVRRLFLNLSIPLLVAAFLVLQSVSSAFDSITSYCRACFIKSSIAHLKSLQTLSGPFSGGSDV